MDHYLTLEQAAEYLQVDTETVRRWVRNKTLRHYRAGKNILRFKKQDLDNTMTASDYTPTNTVAGTTELTPETLGNQKASN